VITKIRSRETRLYG